MTRESQLVPEAIRAEVYERDGGCCRVCGRWAATPGLHHVRYRSEGGLNLPENLVTIGWTPGHDCHLPVVHANKGLWQPILLAVIETPGVTARQLLRWHNARKRSM